MTVYNGRPKGSKNKIGARVKDNIETVFNRLGAVDGMVKWALANSTEFYKIYAKLLPTDLTISHEKGSIEEYVESMNADEFAAFADGVKRIAISAGSGKEAEARASIN